MGLSTHPTGFIMAFDNGYEVSVVFGPGNYCSNRQVTTLKGCMKQNSGTRRPVVQCPNAEAIVFLTGSNDTIEIREAMSGPNTWALMGDGKGLSWATAEQIAELIAWVSKLPMRADWLEAKAD